VSSQRPDFSPVILEPISDSELNHCLSSWRHAMGPRRRPSRGWAHGLRHHGELVAVAATDTLIRARVAGFSRSEAVELSRLCAARPDLCRVMLRLWRVFVLAALAEAKGYRWAVSYQDAARHSGDLYRFDGWIRLARSRSGIDPRTGAAAVTK
jgi:antitoxin VapB